MPTLTIEATIVNVEEKNGGTYLTLDSSPGEGGAIGEAGPAEGAEAVPAELGAEAAPAAVDASGAPLEPAAAEEEAGPDEFTGVHFTTQKIPASAKGKMATITIDVPYEEGEEYDSFMSGADELGAEELTGGLPVSV